MALSKEVSQEQRNYFRVCHLVAKIIPEKLRVLFKQEWDTRYGLSHGNWNDSSKNGIDFYSLTTTAAKKRKKKELSVIKNGNTEQWDGTCLFYAILYSDCIGNKALGPTTRKSVNALREFRNNYFAHANDDSITEANFQSSVQDVITALEDLRFDASIVRDLQNEKTFPTDELCKIKAQLDRERRRNREVPSFCVLSAHPSHEITQRIKESSEICMEIAKLRKINEDKVTVTYITGNPGCGKSELARQIGQKYFDEGDTDSKFVMTLDASSIDSLWLSYVGFVSSLECNDTSINQIVTMQKENKEKLVYLQKELVNPALPKYSSWLLIIDNVDDLKMVSKYIPHAGQQDNGHILLTTQDTKSIPSPALNSFINHFSLSEGMQEDDAVKTLLAISQVDDNDHIMNRVSKAVNNQPLALACAAMWMQEAVTIDRSITWKTFLHNLFEGSLQKVEYVYEDKCLYYNKTMTTAIKMALDSKVKTNKIMKHAFEFLSVIALERIPMRFIVGYVKIHIPNEDRVHIESEIRSSSLINTSEDDSIVVVRVHQSVHHVLKQKIFQNDLRDLSFWLNVIKIFVSDDVVIGNQSEAAKPVPSLFIHLSKIVEQVIEYLSVHQSYTWRERLWSLLSSFTTMSLTKEMQNCITELIFSDCMIPNVSLSKFMFGLFLNTFPLSDRIGVVLSLYAIKQSVNLRDRGLCVLASNLLKRVLSLIGNAVFKAFLLSHHALILTQLGNFEYARATSQLSLDIMMDHYEPDNIAFCCFMSIILNNHGIVLKDLGEFQQSKNVFCTAMEYLNIRSSFFHQLQYLILNQLGAISTHGMKMRSSVTLSNLSSTLQELGEYDQAQDILRKAMEIKENTEWKDQKSLAATLRIQALVYKDLGKYHQAKMDLERAIVILENEEQKYDTNTNQWLARMWGDLASDLQDFGQYLEAKDLLERAQAVEESIAHPNLALTLSRLASVLRDLGKYKHAKSLLKRALDIQKSLFKHGHPNMAITLSILASVLKKLGKYKEAKSHLEKALRMQTKSFDQKHPSLAITEAMYASVLRDLGKCDEAKEQLERVIAVQEMKLGQGHPSVAKTLCIYASVLRDLDEHQKAISHLEKARSIQENTWIINTDHPCIAVTLTLLASNYLDLGQPIKAKTLLEKALNIQEKVFGKDHPDVANTLRTLACVLQQMDRYKNAKEYLERALTIEEKAFDNNHPYLVSTLSNLALVVEKLGDLNQAKILLDRTLSIEQTICNRKPS